MLETCWEQARENFLDLEEAYFLEIGDKGTREVECERVEVLYTEKLRMPILAKNKIEAAGCHSYP